MKFSVILPVRDGEETIKECIDSLLKSDYPKKDFEIIVIDDASRDNTKKIIKGYKGIRFIDLDKNIGKIRARELGAKKAKYNTLVYVDADCVARKDWLLQIKKANYQPILGVAFNDRRRSNVDCFHHLLRKKYYPKLRKPVFITKENFNKISKGTAIFICSKKLFLESSPKEKDKTVSDDILLFSNVIRQKNILKHPGVVVTHLERTDKTKLFKQWFLRGITFADYYLNRTKTYYLGFMFILSLVILSLLLAFFEPIYIVYELSLLFLSISLISIYFSDSIKDLPVFFSYSILVGSAFILGLIRKKIRFIILYFIIVIIPLLWIITKF